MSNKEIDMYSNSRKINYLAIARNLLLLASMATILISCGGSSSTDDSNPPIPPTNIAPSADAGADQSVNENTEVTISGSGTDSDGSISSYAWIQSSGTEVTLQNSNSAIVSFQALNVSSDELLTFELTVTDNDGAVATDSVVITVMSNIIQLGDIPISYNGTPRQNQEATVTLRTEQNVGEINWLVVTQPNIANLSLDKSTDNKTVTFTAIEPGFYQVAARSVDNNTEKTTSFTVSSEFPFDETKVEGFDGSVSVDESIGVIKNQSWVYSSSLAESELRNIIAKFGVFTIIGSDAILGLLIEYDNTILAVRASIEKLKLEVGISSVHNRLFEGEKALRTEQTPDDGSNFDDAGDNWHLEKIKAIGAWDFTIGSRNDILIGVSDAGFDDMHTELNERVSETRTMKKDSHGNAVAGAIAADTNTSGGQANVPDSMSGLNWESKMILGATGWWSVRDIISDEKVVVVNNSWAIPGYIPETFDPTDYLSTISRNNLSLFITRPYRGLAQDSPSKLFVWSAGNGIGGSDNQGNNWFGNKDRVFGVDGRHHSPALHYNSLGVLQKQKNVIFVAAIGIDNMLTAYSNYGRSVDIAAPTSYKSLSINNGYLDMGPSYGDGYTGFNGTSAAAPLVTGVASLIYSLYPDFTGEEVKNILIESATEFVEVRRTDPDVPTETEPLLFHKIPILNAARALKLAEERAQGIIDGGVRVSYSIPDPFSPVAKLVFNPIDENFEVEGVDLGETWDFVNGMSITGNTADVFLDTTTPYHRVTATITMSNPLVPFDTAVNKEYNFNYVTAAINAKDNVTQTSLQNVEIRVQSISGLPTLVTGFTASNGSITTYLETGTYNIGGSLAGYQEAATSISVNGLQGLQIDLNMTSNAAGAVGSLRGQAIDINGTPIIGASIRISGGVQTNGFFATSTTDTNGKYVISNIAMVGSDDNPIDLFLLEASAFGFATLVRNDVFVLSGQERTENFTLNESLRLNSPSGFSATAGDSQVSLSWNEVMDATSYNIYFDIQSFGSPVDTNNVQPVNVTSTNYIVNGLANDTPYYFVVVAVGIDGEGSASNEISDTPIAEVIPELPPNYIQFLEGNPGVEDDGNFIDATNISLLDYSLTAEPKPLVGILENGVIITVVTELPTSQAFAQVEFEFGYLGSDCLYTVDDNNNISDTRSNFEAAYYSPRGLEVITENARSRPECGGINVSDMFLNRIQFMDFRLTDISIDAVIVERGPIVPSPPTNIYGSLTGLSNNQTDINFVPTSAFGSGSTSFIGQWNGPDNAFMQISLSTATNSSIISFRPDFTIGTLICVDDNGAITANGCIGVTHDPAAKALTFSNLRMAVPTPGGTVFTLNGTLLY
jgi:hypothetical protein